MKNQNTKISFLRSAKVRVIIAAVVVVGVATAGLLTWQASIKRNALQSMANVSGAPMIESIPGAGNPTTQYVKQQDIENVKKAELARAEGTSSVPTINRGSFVGSIDTFGQLTAQSQCPIDPSSLPAPDPKNCTVDSLQRARESGVRALELRCKGCTCPALKMAGYTLGDLKESGLDAKSLRDCGFTLTELKAAGFSAADLKAAGFSAAELKTAGFTAAELKAAGFSAKELKDAGFSAAELKAAGFSAAELKAAGFNAKELKDAGFSAAELQAAGFSPAELSAAGFTDQELQNAGIKALLTTDKSCSPAALKQARDAGVSAQALKAKGCGLAALKAAGYTAAELHAAGFSAKQLKDAGFSAKELKDAGFSAAELKDAGFNAAELKAAGFSAKQLKDAGFSAKELKDAGFSAADLKAAGFSAAELKDAGFTAGQLKDAGFSAAELRAAGFSDAELRAAGFTAEQLKDAGATAAELALAGYTKGDLLRAGFTPIEAGYIAPQANAPAIAQTVNPEAAASALMPKIKTNSASDQLAELERQQQLRMSKQQRQDMVMQQQAAMAMQAQKLMVGWSNYTPQARLDAVPDTTPPGGGAVGGAAKSMAGGEVLKAGDILFAVLDTSVNTDEKGTPIMARIVNGQYKGGKLIGRFTLVDKRVLLSFNLLSLPGRDKSIAINAVAIDPDTARTAMSGEVDNHYLLRYGTLFASAFLSGLSDAILTSGSTTENTVLGPVVVHASLNPTQSALVGLGQVGKKYADALGQNINTPPTVKIEGGTGMGLLFMNDVTIPPAAQ